jgi:hypothetical protein
MKKLSLCLVPIVAVALLGLFSSQGGRPVSGHVPPGTLNITDYGASPARSAADNTTAIHNAIADMTAGMTLYVPPGEFDVNAITFGAVNYSLRLEGTFSVNEATTIPANVTVKVGQGGGFTRVPASQPDHLGRAGAGWQDLHRRHRNRGLGSPLR